MKITIDQKELIAKKLENYLYEETGIRLDSSEMFLEEQDGFLFLNVNQILVSRAEIYEDEFNEEDMALILLGNAGNIKVKLTNIKIETLEKAVEKYYPEIRKLISEKFGKEKLDDIFIEIKEVGYDQKHWETEEEVSLGYPKIVLSVSDFIELDFCHELNIYNSTEPIEKNTLIENFCKYLEHDTR